MIYNYTNDNSIMHQLKYVSIIIIMFTLRVYLGYVYTLLLASQEDIITLAAKRRRKGMVIILCICVSFRKKLEKLQTLTAQTSYWQTSNYTRIKNNNRHLLKPFGYKVMTIYITHVYCFQTSEDSWGRLHTSKHKCYCIMTIASKALHQIKRN